MASAFSSVPGPPLHPHCRCDLEPWSHEWDSEDRDGNVVSLPESVRREAERSVIKGWALPSESDAARRRAAEAMLARGPDHLKTKAPVKEAERRLARTPFRQAPPSASPPRTNPPPPPPTPPTKPPTPPAPPAAPEETVMQRRFRQQRERDAAAKAPLTNRIGGADWESSAELRARYGKMTKAETDKLVAEALGVPGMDAPVVNSRRTADGRAAIALTLDDLATRYPDVARRISGGVVSKGSVAGEAWARAPRWMDGGTSSAGLNGGELAFGGKTYGATQEAAQAVWNDAPTKRRVKAGSSWVTVQGRHGVPDGGDAQVGVVAHEFGHHVGYVAEEQALRNKTLAAVDPNPSSGRSREAVANTVMGATRNPRYEAKRAIRDEVMDVVRTEVDAGRVPPLWEPVPVGGRQVNVITELDDPNYQLTLKLTMEGRADPHGTAWMAYVARDVSYYGATNEQETMAESFMDVYQNGPDAAPLSRAIVDRMNELANQARES